MILSFLIGLLIFLQVLALGITLARIGQAKTGIYGISDLIGNILVLITFFYMLYLSRCI